MRCIEGSPFVVDTRRFTTSGPSIRPENHIRSIYVAGGTRAAGVLLGQSVLLTREKNVRHADVPLSETDQKPHVS